MPSNPCRQPVSIIALIGLLLAALAVACGSTSTNPEAECHERGGFWIPEGSGGHCEGSDAPSGEPTPTGPSALASPTPAGTAAPSGTAIAASAIGTPVEPSPTTAFDPVDRTPEPISLTDDPNAIVLSIDIHGWSEGDFTFTEATEMSALLLYRDGRLITQAPQSSREPARALPDLRMTRLSEAGIRAIFDEARAAGLLDGDTTFGSESVPIVALTTTFVVNTADRTTTVSVYALESSPDSDWMTQAGDTFRETHRTLRAFLDRMLTISGSTVGLPESGVINTDWLPAGSVIEADEPYPIERLRIVSEVAGASVGTLLWPLATPLAELGVPYKGDLFDGGRCFVVDDEELATLLPILASARLDDSWESGGQQYLIYPRPLLPGDAGCEMAAADISVGSPGWTGGSRIVFTSNHEWQLQLYSINIDGTELTRLTTNGMYEPLPSPTGEWIAFYSPGDGTVDLVVMRADGSSQTSVSDGSTADASPIWTPDDGPPVWSPDGALLAFHSSRYVGDGVFSVAIHVVNADGSNRRLVLEATGDPVTSVTWLPDGRITYQRKSTAGPQSFVLDVGGSGEVPAPEDVCALPGCSPDGTLIAYTAADGYDGLVVVSADGSESILVAPDVISPPIWSPNSAMLLFERDDNLYVALADGSKTTLLAAWSPDSRAAWSPDSRLIAFNSNMDGVWGLYVVASDGTGLRRLAPNLP